MPDENQPKPHPQDILVVRNVDVGCEEATSEVIETYQKQEEQNNNLANRLFFQSRTHDFDHKDFFEVRYDGQPFRIAPGQTRKMPRYLANHYAMHLVDHILLKEQSENGKQNWMLNPSERERVWDEIIIEVDQYYNAGPDLSVGEQTQAKVEELNDEPTETIEVPPLKQVQPKSTPKAVEEALKIAEEQKKEPQGESKKEKTREELVEEAVKLGIEITGAETSEQLIEKIKKF